jgi:uncharacterized membrane-anchored protein
MVAVFGTMAAGILHVYLGIPYIFSATIYAVSLAVIFGLWYVSEKTLSVHSIYTRRRELFYWAAVLASFAMGTAVGDMTAVTFHLGFFASGIFFAVAIALPAVAYRLIGLNEIVAFWSAYIITRPLGASFADWLAVPPSQGWLESRQGDHQHRGVDIDLRLRGVPGGQPSRCGADSTSRRYDPPGS